MKLPQYQPQFNYQSPSIPGPRLNNPPAVQTNAAMFGGQQGQDLQRLGDQLQQTASRAAYIYDDYNSTKAQEAGNAFQREFLEWQSAANQKKGKDAENVASDYAKWSQERLSTLGRDLNPVQRGRFQEMAAQSGAAQQRWATDYGAEQKRVHKIGELDAGIKIAQDTVVTNIGDPEMTDIALEQIKDQAFSRAKMQGLGEKATMELMHESARGALVPAISGVIKNSDTGLASALIDHYAPQLGASAKELTASLNQERERLRAKAEAQRTRALLEAERAEKLRVETESTAKARGILDSVSGYATLEEAQQKAFELADKEADPAVRDQLRSDISSEMAWQKRKNDSLTAVQVMKFQEFVNSQNLNPLQARDIVNKADKLTYEARERLQKDADGKAQKATPENKTALLELRTKLDLGTSRGGMDLNDAEAIDAYAYTQGLTYEQTRSAHQYAEQGGAAGNLKQSQINRAFSSLFPGKKKTTMPDDLYEMVAGQLEPGKAVTEVQVRNIMARLYTEGETIGGGWLFGDKDESYASALRNNRAESWVPYDVDVPEKEVARIEGLLRENGVTPTPDRVKAYYWKEGGSL